MSNRLARLSLTAPLSLLLVAGAALDFACGNGEDDTPTKPDAGTHGDGGVQSGVPGGGTGTLGGGSDDGGTTLGGGGGGGGGGGNDGGGGGGADGGGGGGGDDGGGGGNDGGGTDAGPGPNTITSLLVLRIGTATTAATADVNPTYIDSVAVSGGAVTNVVDFTSSTFGIAGTGSEGFLTRSGDTHSLAVGGYGAAAATVVATGTPRAIASVSATNVVDVTPLVNASGPFTGAAGAVRSAITNDGSGFWAVGTGTNDGLWFFTHSTTAQAGVQLMGDAISRGLGIFDGQLYESANPGTGAVSAVGSGLPTTGTQTETTVLAGGSPYGFVGFDSDNNGSPDVFYIADNGSGVIRYSLSGTKWTAGTAVALATGSAGAFAITGALSGSSVYLYATNYLAGVAGATAIYALTDDVKTPALAVSATPVATAPTNEVFRGISLPPVAP